MKTIKLNLVDFKKNELTAANKRTIAGGKTTVTVTDTVIVSGDRDKGYVSQPMPTL